MKLNFFFNKFYFFLSSVLQVREALEFALEEDLFAKLIFLYRSPETLIKWTRPKEDTNEDETTDTESVRSRLSVRRQEQQQQQQQHQQ